MICQFNWNMRWLLCNNDEYVGMSMCIRKCIGKDDAVGYGYSSILLVINIYSNHVGSNSVVDDIIITLNYVFVIITWLFTFTDGGIDVHDAWLRPRCTCNAMQSRMNDIIKLINATPHTKIKKIDYKNFLQKWRRRT